MSSNINPNNINGAYPVAGQDNNSQGFRDNFTSTKTNFQYAADEITDLQNKVVLKQALTGTALNNDMNGSLLVNAQLQDMSETRVALGVVSSSQTLNYSLGPYQTLTTGGSVSIAFSNFSPGGTVGRMRLAITVASTAHTLTLPAAVSVGINNIQGINLATNTITFNIIGTYEFEFETNNGGTTITIIDQNRNLDPIYLPSAEDLASSGAANLSLTTSYFSTAGAETATLAAGVAGQVKVLAMYGKVGNMVITVTDPGWAGSGVITFTAVAQACTLMYINSKWFCIGNNGATFS